MTEHPNVADRARNGHAGMRLTVDSSALWSWSSPWRLCPARGCVTALSRPPGPDCRQTWRRTGTASAWKSPDDEAERVPCRVLVDPPAHRLPGRSRPGGHMRAEEDRTSGYDAVVSCR
jgi:hypothetical protein